MTLSKQERNRLQQAKQDARKRVIQRGIVEFRADAELMDQLLQISDFKKVPVGTLVRQWIVPIAATELKNIPPKEKRIECIELLDGRTLTKNSSYQELSAAFDESQCGKIKLSSIEQANLINWIIAIGKKLFSKAS